MQTGDERGRTSTPSVRAEARRLALCCSSGTAVCPASVRRRSAEREAVRLGSGVQELDLEPALDNRPGLADQLVGALVREASATVGRDVGSGGVVHRLAVEEDAERNRPGPGGRGPSRG